MLAFYHKVKTQTASRRKVFGCVSNWSLRTDAEREELSLEIQEESAAGIADKSCSE